MLIKKGRGAIARELSVYVFRARGLDDAFRRLSRLAALQNKEYESSPGQLMRWALVSIDTIDELESRLGDREVFSHQADISPPRRSVNFATRFTMKKSRLKSSGVAFLGPIPRGTRRITRRPRGARLAIRDRSK